MGPWERTPNTEASWEPCPQGRPPGWLGGARAESWAWLCASEAGRPVLAHRCRPGKDVLWTGDLRSGEERPSPDVGVTAPPCRGGPGRPPQELSPPCVCWWPWVAPGQPYKVRRRPTRTELLLLAGLTVVLHRVTTIGPRSPSGLCSENVAAEGAGSGRRRDPAEKGEPLETGREPPLTRRSHPDHEPCL